MDSIPRTKFTGERRASYEAKRRIPPTRCASQLGQFPMLLLPTERAYFALLPPKSMQQPTTSSTGKEDPCMDILFQEEDKHHRLVMANL